MCLSTVSPTAFTIGGILEFFNEPEVDMNLLISLPKAKKKKEKH